MPLDPVRETDLAVGAGPQPQVIPELPVVLVVPRAAAGLREGRSLVVLEPRGREPSLGALLHLGGQVVGGQFRWMPVEHRVRLERQLVGRQVRGTPANALLDVGERPVERLPGQAVHEVEVDVVEVLLRDPDRAPRLVRVVDAAQRLEVRIVEALDADGQPVDPRGTEVAELLRFERARIRLQRDLRIRRDRDA